VHQKRGFSPEKPLFLHVFAQAFFAARKIWRTYFRIPGDFPKVELLKYREYSGNFPSVT